MTAAIDTAADRVLPARPDLEQYKKQARELLKLLKSHRPDAVARLQTHAAHVRVDAARLADAQFVIAREHGFASWPKFKTHIELANAGFAEKVNAFIDAAVGNRLSVAENLLASTPGVAAANIYAACVYGDLDAVRRLLDADPGLIDKPGGPRSRLPLVYACLSRFFHVREAELLSTVRELLDRGADPNSTYVDGQWTLPVLYCACGILNNPQLATMLIDAGANVDDNESLYHSTEFRDHSCTRLLLERGAHINGTNSLKHMLDFDDLEGLRLLLDHGADPNDANPNGETALHWALFRNRKLPFVRMLVERGVDVDARRGDGMTAYRMAARRNKQDIVDFLAQSGADQTLTDVDRRIIAAIAGQGDASVEPELSRALADAAEYGDIDIVRNLLDVGVSADSRGDMNGTALHLAAWFGHPEIVQLLIDRGATVEIEGADLGSTPLQWAIHASGNNPNISQEAAIEIVDILVRAGAIPRNLEFASEEVRRHLEQRFPSA